MLSVEIKFVLGCPLPIFLFDNLECFRTIVSLKAMFISLPLVLLNSQQILNVNSFEDGPTLTESLQSILHFLSE